MPISGLLEPVLDAGPKQRRGDAEASRKISTDNRYESEFLDIPAV